MATDPERVAGEQCSIMRETLGTGDWPSMLPAHLLVMLGDNEWQRPIWQRRRMPPEGRLVVLKRFDDYLMKPFREGLGFKSWWTVHSALETQGGDGSRAIDRLGEVVEDYDEKVRRDRQRNTYLKHDPLAAHGEIGGGHGRGVNHTSVQRGSGNRDYLVARLKRDHPDIARRYEAGEFRSARAAAIEAGIVSVPGGLDRL